MTDTPTTLLKPPKPGETRWAWCIVHMDRTTHLWDGERLICLECHPEQDQRKVADDVHR